MLASKCIFYFSVNLNRIHLHLNSPWDYQCRSVLKVFAFYFSEHTLICISYNLRSSRLEDISKWRWVHTTGTKLRGRSKFSFIYLPHLFAFEMLIYCFWPGKRRWQLRFRKVYVVRSAWSMATGATNAKENARSWCVLRVRKYSRRIWRLRRKAPAGKPIVFYLAIKLCWNSQNIWLFILQLQMCSFVKFTALCLCIGLNNTVA